MKIFYPFIRTFVLFMVVLVITTVVKGNTVENTQDATTQTTVTVNSSGNIVVSNPIELNYTIQIFDLTGKEIIRREVHPEAGTQTISSPELRRGIYLVRVTPAANMPSATIKIMIR